MTSVQPNQRGPFDYMGKQRVPFDRFIFDMWDNNPAYDLTVLCGQLMIDNHGIQARL